MDELLARGIILAWAVSRALLAEAEQDPAYPRYRTLVDRTAEQVLKAAAAVPAEALQVVGAPALIAMRTVATARAVLAGREHV